MRKETEMLKNYIDESNYTVVITGSGISYGYGMRRLKQTAGRGAMMTMLTPHHLKNHPDDAYKMLRDSFADVTFKIGPSNVHKQLAEMEEKGMIQGIVTQNLDYLHELAGSKNVVAFAGSFADNVCTECGETVHDINVWDKGEMPKCPKCGGYLLPVFFSRTRGSTNPWMQRAQDMIGQADLAIVIGTSGFQSDSYMAKFKRDAKLVQINPGSTVFDSMANLNIRAGAEEILGELLAAE